MKLMRSLTAVLVLSLGAVALDNRTAQADLLAADFFFNAIHRLDETTGLPTPYGQIPAGSAGLVFPSGIAIGADNHIYVSSQGTGEILRYDGVTGAPVPSPLPGGRDGLFAVMPDNPGLDPEDPPTPGAPAILRFGPNGKLYVGDFGGTAVRTFDPVTGLYDGDAVSGLGRPGGIAFDLNGDLLVGDLTIATVFKVQAGVPQFLVAPGSGGLQFPGGLLVDPTNGELYVADLFGNQVLKFDSAGQNPDQFAEIPPLPIPNPLPSGADFPTNFPSDLLFDQNGDLLVSVLGLTRPPDLRGALLTYSLAGGDPTTLGPGGRPPVSAIALISTVAVPEPASFAIAVAGAAVLVLGRKRFFR